MDTMKYYKSIERKLERLKDEFPSFMQKNNDFTRGSIVNRREANPSQSLVRGFCEGRETDRKDEMAMGIAFHGTHPDSVPSIIRDGIHEMSCFTNSFHYAVRRSQYHLNTDTATRDAQVIAFAVIVEEADCFTWKEFKTRSPCRYHALPIFIITVH